jgi:hypothetical protein
MTATRRARVLGLGVLLSFPVVLALAAPARAVGLNTKDEPQVVLTGKVVVESGQTVGDVVIFNGPSTIAGTVHGSFTSFNGDVTISGTVTKSVTSFNGDVTITGTARIGGDLVTNSTPTVAPGATIAGTRRHVNTDVLLGRVRWISRFAWWVAVTFSILVFGFVLLWLFPRAAEVVAATALRRVGPSIGLGFAFFFGIPIVAVAALVTVIGIPLGLGTLLALGAIYELGYTASCFALGRALVKLPSNRFLAFLAGWGIMRGVALIPVLGGLLWFAAAVYGLGVLAVAARVRRPETVGVAGAPLAMPPPPPTPAQP